jgi:DNA primase
MIYSTAYISMEICRRLGIDTKGKTGGRVMTSHFDHGHKSPCLSIDLDQNMYHCFSCGEGGTLRSLYYEKTGHGILRDLGLSKDDVYFEPYEDPDPPNFDDPPDSNFEFTGKTVPAESCRQGKTFLDKRGFTREISKRYSMKFVISGITRSKDDPEDKEYHINFKNRVIIPIYERGHLISLEGRDPFGEAEWRRRITEIGKDPDTMSYKKVLYPKLSSVNSLYGLASLDRTKRLYIVEGLLDMISLRTDDEFKNSTAFFGAGITQRQLYLFNQFPEVVIVADRDVAGYGTIRKLVNDPFVGKKLRVLFPPSGCKDVNDILQGKNPNVRTVTEAIEKNWLSKIQDGADVPLDKIGGDDGFEGRVPVQTGAQLQEDHGVVGEGPKRRPARAGGDDIEGRVQEPKPTRRRVVSGG